MISNHGGRQLDGSRAPFDQLPAIVEAVGGKLEIIVRWWNQKRNTCFESIIVRSNSL